MATISEALAIALSHHLVGRLDRAEEIYRRILEVEPDHANALHLMGVATHQAGQHAAAVEYVGRAIAIDPIVAEFHNTLGEAYRALGQTAQAVACYRRAMELEPGYAPAYNNSANALKDQGQLEEAAAWCRKAIRLKPDSAEAHATLGAVLADLGRLEEAALSCQRALELRPELSQAHNTLGAVFAEQGRLDDAIVCYKRVLQLRPDFAEAHCNLGAALTEQGRQSAAILCFQRAVQARPGFAEAHYNLGNSLRDRGRLGEAVASYRRALEIKPDYAAAGNNLGHALQHQGRLDEAIACYRQVLQGKPDFAEAHSNLLFALQYQPGITPAGLRQAHAEYDLRHAAPLGTRWSPHDNDRNPARALRVGFVSPDLGRHPVGYFLTRVLENLDPQEVQTACYSNRLHKDDLSFRLRAAAGTWRDIQSWSDDCLAEQIRSDKIDILFDLAGHTAHNRLPVFARRPAPVQITWAGYPGTTGLAAMDYLLADRFEIPPGAEHDYVEKILRMPDGHVCYEPPGMAPDVGPLPAKATGRITFGSLNNPAKVNREVAALWSRVLRHVPGSRLLLRYQGFDDTEVRGRFVAWFAENGIPADRLELAGTALHREMLATYHRIDIALDPLPYSGGLTTCEALWMGVPVITCPGQTFAGRHSLSHLSTVGLTETIARDTEEYVQIAAQLAGDLPRLTAIRSGLRRRVATSPLCDGKRFAENLLRLLRRVWRQWAESPVAGASTPPAPREK